MQEALYERLPVFKDALDLAVYFEKIVQHFSRYHKYTIGTDLKNLSRRILILIARANTKQERKKSLNETLEKLRELRITIKLCKEVKAFRSFKSFEFATKSVSKVARQCEGWLRSQNSS